MNIHVQHLSTLGLFTTTLKINSNIKKNKSVFNVIEEYVVLHTTFLPTNTSFRERVYCLKNNITTQAVCIECGAYVKYHDTKGYLIFCSCKCAGNSIIQKTKNKQTSMMKYDTINPFQNADLQKKRKITNMSRYGVEEVTQVPEIRAKMKQTTLSRYGVGHHSQLHMLDGNIIDKLNSYEYMLHEHHTLEKGVLEIANNLNTYSPTILRHLKLHEIEIKHYGGSFEQNQLLQYISSVSNKTIINNYKLHKKEIDIFIPELLIGIEYNGIYWHSEEMNRGKYDHVNKTTLCENHNIKLIQIYDIEWLHKTNIVKSRICSALQLNDRIGARKCKIVTLTNEQSKLFFIENHIQGNINSTVCYGLLYNDMIVAAMSFGKARFKITDEVELLRYASKIYTNVIGGASKLLKHYINIHTPSKIVSYADRRWSTGDMYKCLGFDFIGNSPPNYQYFKNGYLQTYSRIQFQKHKLKDKLEIFDPELTEWANMQLNGYNRIWDCGSSKWVMILS